LEMARYASHSVAMENRTGAIPIRMVIAMIAIAKPFSAAVHLPRWVFPRLSGGERRRKRATVDLIHSSPHLLRDIGVAEGNVSSPNR
jgi:uncharacterized protein YjiS (DUF1127 family)